MASISFQWLDTVWENVDFELPSRWLMATIIGGGGNPLLKLKLKKKQNKNKTFILIPYVESSRRINKTAVIHL